MSERIEVLMRIAVGIVSGIILTLWKALVQILTIINWIVALITDERNEGIAEFCEMWNTQIYVFYRYLTMVSNKKPFPFDSMAKNMSHFEK
jgi:sorbitol-specific phosphotransferase system component IIC